MHILILSNSAGVLGAGLVGRRGRGERAEEGGGRERLLWRRGGGALPQRHFRAELDQAGDEEVRESGDQVEFRGRVSADEVGAGGWARALCRCCTFARFVTGLELRASHL